MAVRAALPGKETNEPYRTAGGPRRRAGGAGGARTAARGARARHQHEAHAISTGADCLICSTFFRRILVESGEDTAALVLDDRERTVVEYGVQLARDSNVVNDALRVDLDGYLEPYRDRGLRR